VSQVVELELKLRSYSERKLFWALECESCFEDETMIEDFSRQNCLEAIADLVSLIILSNMVHTRGESLQDGVGDAWTYRITLALTYILCHLSTM